VRAFSETAEWTAEQNAERWQKEGKTEMKKSGKWTVKNVYGVPGKTHHSTPEAALEAAAKREGDGWIVIDELGNQWISNGNSEAVII
jgi:hypothetical protein